MPQKTFQKKQLSAPVRFIKGVGPSISKQLEKLGVKTVEGLIYFLPRDFEDRTNIVKIKDILVGEIVLLKGIIKEVKSERTHRNFSIVKALIEENGNSFYALWFNQPFVTRILKIGKEILIRGKAEINTFTGTVEISVRNYELDFNLEKQKLVPIYPLTDGLYQKKIRKIIQAVTKEHVELINEYLPPKMLKKYNLPLLQDAILGLHFPSSISQTETCRQRLAFDDLFLFQVGLMIKKSNYSANTPGIVFSDNGELINKFYLQLPFKLTKAQEKVVKEIKEDMFSGKCMSRLLQGDVGSGKTIVAFMAILLALQNGYQAAIMAPTEILANQHYHKLKSFFHNLGISYEVLVSNVKKREKNKIYEDLSRGKIQVIIGTHALIQNPVKFKNLGLVVIDEQHRFGVLQRASLISKGKNPDLLVMTATPIPRTLALTVYGDLDQSIIDEMPPGRKPVKTYFVGAKKTNQTYEFIRNKIKIGTQCFVVCPLIEESEKVDLKAAEIEADRLQKEVFPEFKVGLLHGRMPSEYKNNIMQQFKDKEIDILVSTTVIEVGIDIPNANLMLIEQVERFGLAQLHQLRGRIGRGHEEAYCFMFGNPKSADSKRRIKAMLNSTDGFYIAEADLKIRGPGDLYGTAQAGLPYFRIADIIRDEKLLLTARQEAQVLWQKDPGLELPENLGIKQKINRLYAEFLNLGALN